jgi:hypothetical protein
MTVNNRRLYRSLDSATRNDFLGGNYGAYILGKENTTPGISGSQGNLEWLGECVGSLRGLNRIRGLVAWLMVATLLSPRWGLSVCGFLTHGLRRGLCSVAATRLFSVPRFAAILCPPLRGSSVSPLRGYSWKVGAAERRKNAAHGASRG